MSTDSVANLATQPMLVDPSYLVEIGSVKQLARRFARERKEHFGHHNDFIPGQVVLFDGATEDLLRRPVRIYVGGVKGVDAGVVAVCFLSRRGLER